MATQIQSSRAFESIFEQFSPGQRKLIIANVGAIQLTEGCSIGCDFCGFEASKGVRDYIPFNTLEALINSHKKELRWSAPILYWASDPFDYDFDGKKYADIHNLFAKSCGHKPCVFTAVPRGKEQDILSFLRKGNKAHISHSHMNKKRLEQYLDQFGKYAEINYISDNATVTDHYFNSYAILKVGAKNKNNLSGIGLGCFNGALISPAGIYNVVLTKPTSKYPQGIVYTKIEPNDFKVAELYFSPWDDITGRFFLDFRRGSLPVHWLTTSKEMVSQEVKKYWYGAFGAIGNFCDLPKTLQPNDLRVEKEGGPGGYCVYPRKHGMREWTHHVQNYEQIRKFLRIGLVNYFDIDTSKLKQLKKENANNINALKLLSECERLFKNTELWHQCAYEAVELAKRKEALAS